MPWAAHAAHAAHAGHAANAALAAHAARAAPAASRLQLKLLLLLLLLLLRPRAGCVCQARLSSPHGILGMSIRAGGSHGAATGHPANMAGVVRTTVARGPSSSGAGQRMRPRALPLRPRALPQPQKGRAVPGALLGTQFKNCQAA